MRKCLQKHVKSVFWHETIAQSNIVLVIVKCGEPVSWFVEPSLLAFLVTLTLVLLTLDHSVKDTLNLPVVVTDGEIQKTALTGGRPA